jgi:hypothetical protein
VIRILTAALLLSFPSPGFATSEQPVPVTIAECREGGCSCYESELAVSDIEIVLGASMPGGAERPIVVDDGSDLFWADASLENIVTVYGGNGACPFTQLPVPEDGIWASQSRFVSLSCGQATGMLRAMMEPHMNDEIPPRVNWEGIFDGGIYFRSWIAANPDPEHVPASFHQTSAVVSEASYTYNSESGPMFHTARLELLSPRLFRADWYTNSLLRGQSCNWHIRSIVRRLEE